jgi:hypothetical protein
MGECIPDHIDRAVGVSTGHMTTAGTVACLLNRQNLRKFQPGEQLNQPRSKPGTTRFTLLILARHTSQYYRMI